MTNPSKMIIIHFGQHAAYSRFHACDCLSRGIGAVGSAFEWHSKGRGFESLMLHMNVGIKGNIRFTVDQQGSAREMGSGALDVLATPKMIAMLEKAAWESVQPYLEEGCGTVGTLMNVTHEAATPLGMKVTCTSELVAVDGKKLTFRVEAFDEKGRIGGGTHERFVVNNQRFQSKTDQKNEG